MKCGTHCKNICTCTDIFTVWLLASVIDSSMATQLTKLYCIDSVQVFLTMKTKYWLRVVHRERNLQSTIAWNWPSNQHRIRSIRQTGLLRPFGEQRILSHVWIRRFSWLLDRPSQDIALTPSAFLSTSWVLGLDANILWTDASWLAQLTISAFITNSVRRRYRRKPTAHCNSNRSH